jgi:hypothetical protein
MSARKECPVNASATRKPLGLDGGALEAIIATAVRAPSVHNSQPWRFRVTDSAIELSADPSRRLTVLDPDGREMLISCGAALFGLRLAVRHAGFRPVVELLPLRPRLDLLARVHLGPSVPAGVDERRLLAGVWRRHTHRGRFAPELLPPGLLAALRRDAAAESAELAIVGRDGWDRVGNLVEMADRHQTRDPALTTETAAWTRRPGDRDGLSGRAFPPGDTDRPARLRQRDFDLGRGLGTLVTDDRPAPATAVLLTPDDGPVDWMRAGQALHRVLLRAAGAWVFASLHTQPVEVAPTREALRAQLGIGVPQVVMQLGRAHTAPLTWRRRVEDVLSWG